MRKLIWLLLLAPLAALAAPPSATLRWVAPTQYEDGTTITAPITYSLYQGLKGSPKVLAVSGITGLTYTFSTGLSPNTIVCWEVTATVGGQESAHTVEACKTFPPQVPLAPSNLTVN